MKRETPIVDSGVRLLKVATCASLTGKSKLIYHVGCTSESDILFQVVSNSGAGFFSEEWISLKAIKDAFAKSADKGAITSFLLRPLYAG